MHELDLTKGAVLERGCVYIAELQERLKLPKGVSARANPKSSTGRVDVFVRLLTDYGARLRRRGRGLRGPAYHGDRAADLLGAGALGHAAEPAAAQARRAADACGPRASAST